MLLTADGIGRMGKPGKTAAKPGLGYKGDAFMLRVPPGVTHIEPHSWF